MVRSTTVFIHGVGTTALQVVQRSLEITGVAEAAPEITRAA